MSTADCTHCGGFAMVYPAIYTKSAKYTGTMAMFGFLSPWFKYKCMVAAVVSDIEKPRSVRICNRRFILYVFELHTVCVCSRISVNHISVKLWQRPA
jgi:hypothetical protein